LSSCCVVEEEHRKTSSVARQQEFLEAGYAVIFLHRKGALQLEMAMVQYPAV
jgi:hypothetical protein